MIDRPSEEHTVGTPFRAPFCTVSKSQVLMDWISHLSFATHIWQCKGSFRITFLWILFTQPYLGIKITKRQWAIQQETSESYDWYCLTHIPNQLAKPNSINIRVAYITDWYHVADWYSVQMDILKYLFFIMNSKLLHVSLQHCFCEMHLLKICRQTHWWMGNVIETVRDRQTEGTWTKKQLDTMKNKARKPFASWLSGRISIATLSTFHPFSLSLRFGWEDCYRVIGKCRCNSERKQRWDVVWSSFSLFMNLHMVPCLNRRSISTLSWVHSRIEVYLEPTINSRQPAWIVATPSVKGSEWLYERKRERVNKWGVKFQMRKSHQKK